MATNRTTIEATRTYQARRSTVHEWYPEGPGGNGAARG